ncbi:ATP-binding cassette domain-containing protein [bacterium]|nr:ATP-binding cassette domain-containing protein [bacterium]
MIQVANLCKSYGGQTLFRDASFSISARERVGLVGRNGHGKTTLFRLILGHEDPDSGTINRPKNYRIGYLEQHLSFTEETVLQEACKGLPIGQEHDAWRAEKVLAGLGFSTHDAQRPLSEFSGGFQVRLNLAKVLVSSPDLLLLDEPTNYLDIAAIRWLTRFLQGWPSEFILITHDRGFMDSVTTHTLGIHRQRMRKIRGGTDKYYEQIAADEEVYEKTRLNDEKRRKEVEKFIRRFRAKARLANLVQSRIKTLQKRERKEKLQAIETLEFSFKSEPFNTKIMLEAKDIGFSYPDQPQLFNHLNLMVGKQDRICIVGKNGRGKTTLLKILAGVLDPVQGEARMHPTLRQGYFEQTNTAQLDPNRTVEEEIMYTSPACTQQQARDIAGAMMFSGDDALKKISVLSGGEKSRVLLGKILVTPCHLLLLDEPTNHFDMESGDSLMAALDAFDGAVILVTHNEMFLHTLANRLIVFDRDKHLVYEGPYQSFLEDVGWESDESLRPPKRKIKQVKTLREATPDKKALRKRKAELVQERSRALRPLEENMAALETAIEAKEIEAGVLTQKVVDASTNGDGEVLAELAKEERGLRIATEKLYSKLEEATAEFERKSTEFDEKLANLAVDL